MPEISWDQAPEADALAVGGVVEKVEGWELTTGRDFRSRSQKYYRQYRGFRQFADEWTRSPNDRDALEYEAGKHWGAHLHIPMSFRMIETVVPRAVANSPKLLYMPRDEQWHKNVETVRLLIDSQQEQISIDQPFQNALRTGLLYGIGASKSYWRREVKTRRRQKRRSLFPGYVLSKPETKVVFDDPMYEDIDIFDFMWDPYGSDMRTCEWVVHRTWLSTKAVMQRLREQVWNTESAALLDEEKVRALGPTGKHYEEIWQDRMLASGFSAANFRTRGEQPHELLEWHDGEVVYSVLDRQVLVQEGENACGDMPFQIFRPIPLPKQMVGIGYLEPLEHLQRELDTLRSQRRDAATMRLAPGWVFDDAAVDEEDLTFGPNQAIRVTNSTPKDAIQQIQTQDIPGSGYQEEQAIRSDMDIVSGVLDAVEGTVNGAGTATEAQLSHASLSARIELLSRRFETEVVRDVAKSFLYLDQRMIAEQRPPLRVPDQGMTHEEAAESGRWRWFPIGPGELEGEYEIAPEGGSMAARNIPQDRADAQWIMNNLAHDWYINPTKARLRAMELGGIKHPKAWLRDPTPSVPMATLRFLIQAGVDPSLIVQSVLHGRETSAPQEGPPANQITEMVETEGNE